MVYSNVVAMESHWCDKPCDQIPVLQLSNGVSEASRAPARHYEQCANMRGEELAILWLEWCGATGDSIPDMGSPATLPWALAQPLLQSHAVRYVVSKNQGHVILAGFDDVNAGLLSAWQIREVLQRVGIRVRVGMHWGHTVVHMHPLTSCISMIGASVQGAVHLARLAKPREVLIAVELRYHPKVQQEHFVFIPQQRLIQTDGSSLSVSQTLSVM